LTAAHWRNVDVIDAETVNVIEARILHLSLHMVLRRQSVTLRVLRAS